MPSSRAIKPSARTIGRGAHLLAMRLENMLSNGSALRDLSGKGGASGPAGDGALPDSPGRTAELAQPVGGSRWPLEGPSQADPGLPRHRTRSISKQTLSLLHHHISLSLSLSFSCVCDPTSACITCWSFFFFLFPHALAPYPFPVALLIRLCACPVRIFRKLRCCLTFCRHC